MSDAPVSRPQIEGSKGVLARSISGLVLESNESDYAADGFHQRHTAAPEQVAPIAEAFRSHGYVLEMITCEDRREEDKQMRLVYTYNRFDVLDRHVVEVDLSPEIPGSEAPSICDVYRAADWFEREIFDMYGVRFTDHPDLKRILLPDDSDFYALLKDFGRIEDAPETDD